MSSSAAPLSSTAAAAPPSPWLFGRSVDLWLGYGLAYVASVPLVVALVAGGWLSTRPAWGTAALALAFSTPHYGATLLRVYDRRQDRHRYAVFAVWITLALIGLFALGLYEGLVGSLLLTAYVTWSPWHFSGQNYGLAVMYLRRRGIAFDAATKRDLYVGFVLSAALAIAGIHAAGSGLSFAAGSYDPTATFLPLRIHIPLAVLAPLMGALALAYLFFTARGLRALARTAPPGTLLPVALLVGTQALWFSVPALAVSLARLDLPLGLALALSAVWISTAHAIQYLWVTCYYTKHAGDTQATVPFLGRSLLAGAALTLPAILLLPGLFGRSFPNAGGTAVLLFSTINLHHFILDGAIWKLRDGRVARALLRSGDDRPEAAEGRRWLRPALAAVGAACVLFQVQSLWLSHVVAAPGTSLPTLQRAAASLEWMGRATPELWQRLGRDAEEAGQTDLAVRAYRLAMKAESAPPPWVANRLAWLLLDGQPERPKSAQQALQLAEYVSRRLGPEDLEGYRLLAAAQAATGDYQAATDTAERGLATAGADDASRARDLERRLDVYRRLSAGGPEPRPRL